MRKLAVVTGAGKGIGRAIAVQLAKSNHDLILVSKSRKNLEETASEARISNVSVEHHVCDLLRVEERDAFADSVMDNSRAPSVLVNNLGGSLATSPMATVEEWALVWQFNVGIGHYLNTRFLPLMIEKGWGRIVHVSTLSTSTFAGYPAYVSAKCALEGYVKSMARVVFSDGVVMSAVAPGAISVEGKYLNKLETENPTALKEWLSRESRTSRLGQPAEVAHIVDFLCSNQASYMAGSIVEVDGGG